MWTTAENLHVSAIHDTWYTILWRHGRCFRCDGIIIL